MISWYPQNDYIIEIGHYTEKSPGDFRWLAVTQTSVKEHQLMAYIGQTTKDSSIYKNIIYIFILRLRRVWSRNTVREISHISFFRGGDPLCVLEGWLENTHDMFAWVTSWSHPSLERPADLCLQSKFTDLILSLSSKAEIWTFSLP